MKIYVAAASLEIPRARRVMSALEKAGHTITHDWTTSVDMFSDGCSTGELEWCALSDYYGVTHADALLLLSPVRPSTGAWVELGIALAAGCRVMIAGGCNCIFAHHPKAERFADDYAAIQALGGAL